MWGPRGVRCSARLAAVIAATGLVAVSGIAGTSAAGGDPAPAAFRLTDGSAGCRLVDVSTLACRSAPADVAAVLDADGDSRPADVDVAWDESTPVLLPAESWWHGPFTCRVRERSLACVAGDGAITVAAGAVGGVR